MKKKDLVILLPLLALSLIIGVSAILSVTSQTEWFGATDVRNPINQCQEGWFKYETEDGIVCSKTEIKDDNG